MTTYLYVAITPRYVDGCRLSLEDKWPLTYIKIGDAKDPEARAKQYYTHNPDVALFPIAFDNWNIDGILANDDVKDALIARVGSWQKLEELCNRQPGKVVEMCVFDKNYSRAAAGKEWYKAINCEAKVDAFLSHQNTIEKPDWKHFASAIDFILAFREVIAGHSID